MNTEQNPDGSRVVQVANIIGNVANVTKMYTLSRMNWMNTIRNDTPNNANA